MIVGIPEASWRRQPWHNGRGVTAEICRWPDDIPAGIPSPQGRLVPALAGSLFGSVTEPYAVRVSLAAVTAGGPFSRFPGYVRTSVLVGPSPVIVASASRAHRLQQPGDLFVEPGELQLDAWLPSGPTELLNVLVRRGDVAVEPTIGVGPCARPVRFRFSIAKRVAQRIDPPEIVDTTGALWVA